MTSAPKRAPSLLSAGNGAPTLPSYTSSEEPLPSYTPPSRYVIGNQPVVQPFVGVEHLRAHLALLRAFKNLRTAVEEDRENRLPEQIRNLKDQCEQSMSLRWGCVVALAVERFDRWVKTVAVKPLGQWVEEELPPIDVLMVWHAYMLNPLWYAEDCERLPVLNQLKSLRDMLLSSIVKIGDINNFQPSDLRRQRWRTSTGTSWDIFDAASSTTTQMVECPRCYSFNTVPLIDPAGLGRGYTQRRFEYRCTSCAFIIKKDGLALLKFARALVLDYGVPGDVEAWGLGVYIAGSLWNPYNPKDETRAKLLKLKLYLDDKLKKPQQAASQTEWLKAVMENMDYTIENLVPRVSRIQGRSKRVLGAYFDDRPFSVDLAGAVIRQGSFIDKMAALGWTEPGFFEEKEDEVVLVHAIARYHAFMDLMSSSPGSFFVPTLDIDLAWHTHQLTGSIYHGHCVKHIGRYIDHDDKVEESRLAVSFDVTCRAWEKRYQVPYTYCGCPLPGDTIGQRLNRLKRRISISTPASQGLTPPRRPDALSATHASEHNSVYLPAAHGGFSESERKKREEKLNKRKERDGKLVRDGKIREEGVRANAHDPAFLYPVPLYAYGLPLVGCVSVGGPGIGWTGVGGAVLLREVREGALPGRVLGAVVAQLVVVVVVVVVADAEEEEGAVAVVVDVVGEVVEC